jgi:hypothetical protein
MGMGEEAPRRLAISQDPLDLAGIHRSEKGQSGIEKGRPVAVHQKDRDGPVSHHVNIMSDFAGPASNHGCSTIIAGSILLIFG